jgi:hypothetical protein
MDKAYDLKALATKISETGLPALKEVAEEEAKLIYIALKAWLVESATLSENKVDDFVTPFLDKLDPIVLPVIDKIDGQEG